MDQLTDYADDRLINGCIYCGGPSETRDHVPSRVLLNQPYPENLPVVGACSECNQGFSKDELYVVCLIEATIAGSADPDKIRRPSVAEAMRRSPALHARIEAARKCIDGRIEFAGEADRIRNVVLKLARGHAAFELSQPCRGEPDHLWWCPMPVMAEAEWEEFNSVHFQNTFGEVGSRGLRRMLVTQVVLPFKTGERTELRLLVNDWVDVQEGCYRYLAIDDHGGIVIRIVIADYLACEVGWRVNG